MNENALQFKQTVEASDRLAWNLKCAATVIGVSYRTIRREIQRRKLFPTVLNLLSKKELLRYLDAETQITRRRVLERRADVVAPSFSMSPPSVVFAGRAGGATG